MSFLSFRQARRKAKKIVSVRAQRPPTPPSPDRDSCVFPSVVEIGDPSRVSAEAFYSPATLHVDITSGPLFPSDPFPGSDHPSTNAGQSQDQASHTGLGGASSKLPHDGAGSEQQRVRVLSFEAPAFIRCWCRVTEDDLSGWQSRGINCG